jgi:hypothetical protein
MSTNKFAGQCISCGTAVEAGAGTVAKINGAWATSHIDCTPTALTVTEVAALFPSLTASQLETIVAVNLTEDEIDDSTGIINQAGVTRIALVVANNAAYEARMAESAAKLAAFVPVDPMAAYRAAHGMDQS